MPGEGAALAVENPATEETVAERGAASPEQVDAAHRRRARGVARVGEHSRARARRDAARGGHAPARPAGRDRPRDDPRGRQAAGREHRRGRLDRGGVRLLRRDRAQLRRPGDPADRVHAAGDGAQGADGRGGRDRAVELPAAAAGLEARARPGRGQHGGGQAVGGHAAVHADARRLPRPPARRAPWRCSPAPATWAGRSWPTSAWTAWPSPGSVETGKKIAAEVRRAGGADQPRDGRQGPVHRVRRRGGPDRHRRPRRAPGPRTSTPGRCAPRPSASTCSARSTTTS